MAIAVLGCVGVSSDASRAALVPTQTATSIAPSPIPTTAAPTTILTGAVASATVVPPGVQPAFDGVGAGGEPSLAPANTVVIGGPRVDVGTEQATTFVFSATAGQSISLRSNRAWKLEDPLGREVAADESRAISIDDSGRYLVRAAPGLRAPASLAIVSIDPSAIVSDISVGQVISVSTGELRNHYARVPLRGGQRYRLIVPNGQGGASFCAVGTTGTFNGERYCVGSSTLLNGPASSTTFVLRSDQVMELTGTVSAGDDGSIPQTIRAQIDEALNDVLADTKSNAVVELEPKDGQGVVVPFWGSPSERAVLSSPVAANVSPWGDPWIDREDGGSAGRLKVYAVPFTFNPANPPFVTWRGSTPPNPPNRQRVGVYRGEDTAVLVGTTGEPATVRNAPWFASIGSLNFEAGGRYVLQVAGKNIRPLSLAVRDPSGKFTSSLSPWQWSEEGGEQRAVTTVSANRPGKWALEMRLAGNAVRDLKVSALYAGGGGSYEGVVDVDDVLNVGESTDVQLGPNEFARMTVKLTSASPQIVQPDVQRYRTKTFQPTAADMSLWDSRGRLVWSNNRNLEEEVLSGRLGKEPQLSERFATVSSTEPYTLIIDPHTDLSGRFRVSVVSTPVTSDVALGTGPVPLLAGGTLTGVVEVREPTRYRLTGASACLTVTSLAEWNGGVVGVAGGANTPRCVRSGSSISLPVGVHRFTFLKPLTSPASFAAVAVGSAPDPVPISVATIDGSGATLPAGEGEGIVQFTTNQPSTRLVVQTQKSQLSGGLVAPDGTRRSFYGSILATLPGTYSLYFGLDATSSQSIQVRTAISELQTTTLAVGAKSKVFAMSWGQRLEGRVVLAKRTRLAIDAFAETGSSINLTLIADDRERRFSPEADIVLNAGAYRLVFTGNGNVRVGLKRLPLPLGR